jgi:tRNA(Ile)-lysidine synthase
MSALFRLFSEVVSHNVQPNSRLVLALSGGLDSRVLLDLTARYVAETRIQAIAVHVHHGLSNNADDWAKQCRVWCEASNIPFHIEYVSLNNLNGESLEERARVARYDALKHYIGDSDSLVTGQHSDDQLETFLLALKRGSGPKGLSSMAKVMPFGRGAILRPLLTIDRDQIEAYAKEKQLSWVEDESNQNQRFDRNFIRHQIAPQLKQRWPSILNSVQRSAELCAEQELLLKELLQPFFERACRPDGSLCLDILTSVSRLAAYQLIRLWLGRFFLALPSQAQMDTIWRDIVLAQQDANPVMRFNSVELRRFDGALFVVPSCPDLSSWQQAIVLNQPLILPETIGILTLTTETTNPTIIGASDRTPYWVNFNPEGLSAHPVGRLGSRKLKKLFQEYRVPSWLRRRTPILMCGERVAAVANLFVDCDFSGKDCELTWDKNSNFVPELLNRTSH